MRWGPILCFFIWGCGDDATMEPDVGMPDSGSDASMPDTGTDAGSDAGADAGADAGSDTGSDTGMDAPMDVGGGGTCGWNAVDMELQCGAGDTPPVGGAVTCTDGVCCTGTCDPDGDGEVCCDLATGVITTEFYSGGTCETDIDPCTEPTP